MRAQTIFAVVAYTAHEKESVLRTFATRDDAEAFAHHCEQHQKSHPLCPRFNVPASDPAWPAYYTARDEWLKNHPGCDAGGFEVNEVPLMVPDVDDAMIDRALSARVPGGAAVSAWLPMLDDARTPHPTAREVMRAALTAALCGK
jgi:hypothetical protein